MSHMEGGTLGAGAGGPVAGRRNPGIHNTLRRGAVSKFTIKVGRIDAIFRPKPLPHNTLRRRPLWCPVQRQASLASLHTLSSTGRSVMVPIVFPVFSVLSFI